MNSRTETFSTYFFPFLVCITVLFFLDLEWKLRFSEPAFNYLSIILVSIALPVSAYMWSYYRKSLFIRFCCLVFSLLLALPCFLALSLSSLTFLDIVSSGYDSSFEVIDETVIDDSKFVLYRTNGGATTAFGIRLQKEVDFMVGLKLVKTVHKKYRAAEASLELERGNVLKLTIQPYSEGEKVEVLTFGV